MKRLALIICSTALVISACNSKKKTEEKDKTVKDTTSSATTMDTKVEPMTMPDSATMMKNMQAYATPGEMQKMLAKSAGTWTSEGTYWVQPGAPPQKFNGKTENKMVMGGRYQVSHDTGKMMGMDFEGQGTVAYDNFKKVFVSTWMDNMGTGIMTMEGSWDDATKSINFKGKMVDPGMNREVDARQVFKVVDDNNQVMEMYGPDASGKEYKWMEIKYMRKK